jgi:hypothetical protein
MTKEAKVPQKFRLLFFQMPSITSHNKDEKDKITSGNKA